MKAEFGIEHLVVVGDRGMISHKGIEELKTRAGRGLDHGDKSAQIRCLVEDGGLQLGLFDERNLFEFTHPDYPGERLVACRNSQLAKLRAAKRRALLEATSVELEKVCAMVAHERSLRGRDKIGVRVGRVVNKYKVAKHFELQIEDDRFAFALREDQVGRRRALDGIYVLRTRLPLKPWRRPKSCAATNRLPDVERAFRSLKTVDLKVRPIHHRLADRVRAHIFLCMLAYYVEWHMREAWRAMLFADEDQAAKLQRDPVAPAKRSASSRTQGAHPHLKRWHAGAQLPHPPRRTLHDRAQHLPHRTGLRPGADLHDRHSAQPRPTARTQVARDDRRVANRVYPIIRLNN